MQKVQQNKNISKSLSYYSLSTITVNYSNIILINLPKKLGLALNVLL